MNIYSVSHRHSHSENRFFYISSYIWTRAERSCLEDSDRGKKTKKHESSANLESVDRFEIGKICLLGFSRSRSQRQLQPLIAIKRNETRRVLFTFPLAISSFLLWLEFLSVITILSWVIFRIAIRWVERSFDERHRSITKPIAGISVFFSRKISNSKAPSLSINFASPLGDCSNENSLKKIASNVENRKIWLSRLWNSIHSFHPRTRATFDETDVSRMEAKAKPLFNYFSLLQLEYFSIDYIGSIERPSICRYCERSIL